MSKFQKILIILLSIFIIWCFCYLVFFDTYWFKIESTSIIKCNKKTGSIYIFSANHPEKGWRSIKDAIKSKQFEIGVKELIEDE